MECHPVLCSGLFYVELGIDLLVDSVNTVRASAVAAIQMFENRGGTAPTIDGYASAGVSGVDATNLALVNAAVAESVG